ncbi:MAG TPA: hypothetical protein VG106_04440, partial [Vicinamibacterales bacterium]|nr:hypothetical protein [Vicinamibacterales bacterium]
AGSGADRHENFSKGRLEPDVIAALTSASGADVVICETPWSGIAEDITWLKERVGTKPGARKKKATKAR